MSIFIEEDEMDRRYYAIAGAAFAGIGLIVSATGAAGGAPRTPAAPVAVTKAPTTKQVKAIARKQANKVVTARAPGLTVGTAGTARPSGAAGGSLTGTFPNPALAPGTVTTPQLADDAVTADKLADASVDNAALQGAPVAARNLMAESVTADALAGYSITSAAASVLAGQTGSTTVTCPGGSRLIAGGGVPSDAAMHLVASYPLTQNTWRVTYQNTGGATHFYSAVASCLETIGG